MGNEREEDDSYADYGYPDFRQVVLTELGRLRDRRALAAEGLLVISVALDRASGRPVTAPEIVARGLPGGEDGKLLDVTRTRVERVLERRHRGLVEPRLIHDLIKEAAASYVLHETGLRPTVLPVVTEV